jgi:hypothetical protein
VSLWLLVALQVAIPASYYLVREDRDDERFAWRMFSAVRLTRCEVSAWDEHGPGDSRSIPLSRALHASWIRSLERGRQAVIERFLASRCRELDVVGSKLDRDCKSPAGEPLPLRSYQHACNPSGRAAEPL